MNNRRKFLKDSALFMGSMGLMGNSALGKSNSDYEDIVPFNQGYIERPIEEGIPLRFRQVHLDFHTSEYVEGVGEDFDPERFAYMLKQANVDSVTVFAKGCHGHVYYDSQKFPELIHPHSARRNLLKEQIEACHKQGIRTPIYTVVQWDVKQSQNNADWLMLDIAGNPIGTPQNEPGFNRYLCVNNPYGDMTKAIIQEVNETLPVDGWFIDILMEKPCYCSHCKEGMRAEGLNPLSEEDGIKYSRQVFKKWKREVDELIRGTHKKATVFYNTGHVGPYIRKSIDSYSHLELESLPSGGWGYMHFPTTSRYARCLGKDLLGMTGKFHTSWGDFHSLKNKAALEFETFLMLALNAKCSIGDQLHPNGQLDPATYKLIGSVYEQIAQKEAWCFDASPVTEIGVLHPEAFMEEEDRKNSYAMGAVRMLQELQVQFDLIDAEMNFANYKLLILPDVIPFSSDLKGKIEQYINDGGGVLASYHSGLTPDKKAFASNTFGLNYLGEAKYAPNYIKAEGKLVDGLEPADYVMYQQGAAVQTQEAEVLLSTHNPYFNRTAEHFLSHQHAPSSGEEGSPAATQNKNVIYFSHPVFAQYHANAPVWCKKLVGNAIKSLLGEPIVVLENAPSSTIATVNYQEKSKRYILHLLCYFPERRGEDFDVIEDVVPVHDIAVSIKLPQKINRVTIVPQGKRVSTKTIKDRILFSINRLEGHQMVELAV